MYTHTHTVFITNAQSVTRSQGYEARMLEVKQLDEEQRKCRWCGLKPKIWVLSTEEGAEMVPSVIPAAACLSLGSPRTVL